MWFQAMAIAPVAAGAAIGTTWPTPDGRSSATSRAIIPPSEPPVTTAQRSMPRASARAHSARASSRAVIAGNDGPHGAAGGGILERRPGRAVVAAEEVRAQDADDVRVEREPGADEGRPPVAGRVGRPGERVDDEHLRRVRAGPVVAVGDREWQGRAAGLEGEPPEVGMDHPPGPERGPGVRRFRDLGRHGPGLRPRRARAGPTGRSRR